MRHEVHDVLQDFLFFGNFTHTHILSGDDNSQLMLFKIYDHALSRNWGWYERVTPVLGCWWPLLTLQPAEEQRLLRSSAMANHYRIFKSITFINFGIRANDGLCSNRTVNSSYSNGMINSCDTSETLCCIASPDRSSHPSHPPEQNWINSKRITIRGNHKRVIIFNWKLCMKRYPPLVWKNIYSLRNTFKIMFSFYFLRLLLTRSFSFK